MELKLNIKAKHESRTRLNQLGRLAHNRYASFAHTIIEKIRNFITKNFLPNPSTYSHKTLIEELKEFCEDLNKDSDENYFLLDNKIFFTYAIIGIISDGYLLLNMGSRCIKIEDFTKSSLELSDGNIIIMIQMMKMINHAFPVWIVDFEKTKQEEIFYVREFCKGIHSGMDGPFYLIDKFENIKNLEIDNFFKYNYKKNPSSYNFLLAKKHYHSSLQPFARDVYLGWLERWKNRF